MNQRGFATIFGLCLVLIVALVAKGIQAAQMNHAYETANFGAEFDLQNAADGAIYAAADKVLSGDVTLPVNDNPYYIGNTRDKFQRKILTTTTTSEHIGTITTEAWGEIIDVQHYKVAYKGEDDTNASKNNVAEKIRTDEKIRSDANAYVFFSVAQATNPQTGAKIYRRAFAYVVQGDATIHFMEVPMSSYRFGG